MLGDAQLTYAPGHPRYADVLQHLGWLDPGQDKPVPPWPDCAACCARAPDASGV
jgi:hypothetical protein